MDIVATTSKTYPNNFEIQPKSNVKYSMNQWAGAGSGKKLNLWHKGDDNNSLRFVSQEEYLNQRNAIPSIIPYPASLDIVGKGSLSLKSLKTVSYPKNDEATKVVIEDFISQLYQTSGIKLKIEEKKTFQRNSISLVEDSNLPEEGYTMNVDNNGIIIKAAKPVGFFYGIQSLKQLLPREYFGKTINKNVKWELPYINITDEPLLGHRGFMLDVSRHFFDKDEVKKVLDIMALYKLNRFHWHLTDDQGWRIEIPEYPLLTEVGSKRAGSFINAGGDTKFFEDTEY